MFSRGLGEMGASGLDGITLSLRSGPFFILGLPFVGQVFLSLLYSFESQIGPIPLSGFFENQSKASRLFSGGSLSVELLGELCFVLLESVGFGLLGALDVLLVESPPFLILSCIFLCHLILHFLLSLFAFSLFLLLSFLQLKL